MDGPSWVGILLLLVAVATLALAGLMAWRAIALRPSRAFALLLFVHAAWMMAYGAGLVFGSRWLWHAFVYPFVTYGLATLFFSLQYPTPRLHGWRSAASAVIFVGAAATVWIAYAADHGIFMTLPGAISDPFGPLYDPATAVGPLGVLALPVNHLMVLLSAVLIVRRIERQPTGGRRLTGLVAVGLLMPFLGACEAIAIYIRAQAGFGLFGEGGVLLVRDLILALEVITMLLFVAYMIRRWMRERDGTTRTVFAAILALIGLAAAMASAAMILDAYIHPGYLFEVFFAVSLLAGDLVLAYALFARQVFDMDVRVHTGIKRGSIGTIFVGVFFVVSLAASEYLLDAYGYILGALAAGLLFLVLRPLQRLGERVANVAVPPAIRDPAALYRQQVWFAMSDGEISADERRMLDFTRKRLGITEDAAARLEADA